MNNAIVSTAKLVALGDAIRAKAGLSDNMTLDEMVTAVESIETGGGGGTTVKPTISAILDSKVYYSDYEGVFHADDAAFGLTLSPCYIGTVVTLYSGSSSAVQVSHLEQKGKHSNRYSNTTIFQVIE